MRGLQGTHSVRPKEAALPRVLEEEQHCWKSPQYGALIVSEPGWRARGEGGMARGMEEELSLGQGLGQDRAYDPNPSPNRPSQGSTQNSNVRTVTVLF